MLAVSADSATAGPDYYYDDLWYRTIAYIGDSTAPWNEGPLAFIAESAPHEPDDRDRFETVAPHFHLVRQFQVFVRGDRPSVGKRDVHPFDFHYVDPSTPYGPFMTGKGGLAFFTLRPPGAQKGLYWMPGSREKMTRRAGRNLLVAPPERADLGRETLLDPADDGLAAFRVTAAAGEPLATPAPEGSGGQYCVVMEGSVVCEGRSYPPLSLVWVEPDDGPAPLTAGDDGAAILVLQFPLRDPATEPTGPAAEPSVLT